MIVTAKLIPQTRIRRCCVGEASIEREREREAIGKRMLQLREIWEITTFGVWSSEKKKRQRRFEGNGALLDLQAYSNVIKRVLVF